MNDNARIPREPWLAVNLSMVFPGIGQVYAGRRARGCVFIFGQVALFGAAGWLALSATGNTIIGVTLLLTTIVVGICSLVDAHKCARKANAEDFERSRNESKDPWLAVFLSRLLPGLGHLYVRKCGWGIILVILWIVLSAVMNIYWPFLIVVAVFSALVCYHAYVSSLVRREASRTLVKTVAVVILVLGLAHRCLPVLIKENVVQVFKIPSGNMIPTLQPGDRILVEKSLEYPPNRGDVIVFRAPTNLSRDFIKRIIGLPGDTIEIDRDTNTVMLNGEAIAETYIQGETTCSNTCGPWTVPEEAYFVMGDNRQNSSDSRQGWFVPEENIIGKALITYWRNGGPELDLAPNHKVSFTSEAAAEE